MAITNLPLALLDISLTQVKACLINIILLRYLSDHHPILLRESIYDYGPIPLKFYHYWFEIDGFDKLIEDSWNEIHVVDNNAYAVDLEREVSKEEVKRAAWDCGIDKAPGCEVVFIHERIPSGGNSSFITLIPKVSNANMVKDFRPISLIGSVYKIVAKILANRLVLVLGDLVSDTQSAFLKERQISDGPFILNELIQWCKKKKKQSMIFKVDFEKAYDSVRWDFVDTILKKFGFGDKWCKELTNCRKNTLKTELANLDSVLDRGEGIDTDVTRRSNVVRILQDIEKTEAMEVAQKAKIKWAVEGDENSKYYHGVINKKRNNLAIRGVLVDGNWAVDLEREVSKEEVKRAVWDCGIDKAPGPDGFTFGFYRCFWNLIECDVVKAVKWFFLHERIPSGGNSSFITLIPKVSNANMCVQDCCQDFGKSCCLDVRRPR
nr:RNA-directed DNA polymerase, eukaryota, reverse transcriptase zinc-binding domain protein [Tanacetum cinerariifolium]